MRGEGLERGRPKLQEQHVGDMCSEKWFRVRSRIFHRNAVARASFSFSSSPLVWATIKYQQANKL